MKIFVDTADLDEIKEAESWGILDGVTTNPSLIKKAVEDRRYIVIENYIPEILKAVYPRPVSLEVIGTTAEDMVREAKILDKEFGRKMEKYAREIGDNDARSNVVVKIPINTALEPMDEQFEGIKAIKELENSGIKTNATLVMTPEQALMAAKAGASYVSPFLGRVDDYVRGSISIDKSFDKSDYWNKEMADKKDINNGIRSGVELLEDIMEIYRNYGFTTEVIAASIRNARQVREVAKLGVDIATIPFPVIKNMMSHYKTREGVKKFIKDVVPDYREIFHG
ncbi:MAG: transaldolase [Candidatus Aenigmarchaeota archaeon]|nr:transaldolase [Candidatus Aenigmarchaeota archaeon]